VSDIRQLTTDISKLGLSEKAPDFEQQKQLLNDLSLAMELGVTKQFIARELDEAFEHYIDVSTRSMRLLSIIGTLILGVMITSIIIAMYSPIFMFGSIF
jgi:type II secretory pathway component PulF